MIARSIVECIRLVESKHGANATPGLPRGSLLVKLRAHRALALRLFDVVLFREVVAEHELT